MKYFTPRFLSAMLTQLSLTFGERQIIDNKLTDIYGQESLSSLI